MKRGVVLRSAWKIARAYWFSEEKWTAWGLLLVVIALNLSLVYITVRLNVWQSSFYQVIQNYNQAGFFAEVASYVLLAFAFILVKGYQIYTRMLLHIHWRSWLTDRYLSRWMQNKTYYRLQLMTESAADNPDQRISEDIELFVLLTLRLSLDLLQDAVTVLSFVVILWELSGIIELSFGEWSFSLPGYLVWAALVYAGIGTYFTLRVGRPLVKLDYDQQRYEADFRFSLFRVREYGESIAFYKGEGQEKRNCMAHFQHVIENFRKIILVRKRLMWLTTSYSQVSVIFAILVASPGYFRNQIHLGQMFQVIDAYHHVQTGFSFIIDSFTRLAQWRAVVNRLNHFLVCMEAIPPEQVGDTRERIKGLKKKFVTEALHVFRPDGGRLLGECSLTLEQGDRVLITGASGCGKSTLLRTLSGLWPYMSGKVRWHQAGSIFFIPQKAYMPVDSLRQALVYPSGSAVVKDVRLEEMLKECRLSHLIGQLDEIRDWGQALSLGEQQRVAFIRMLLRQPAWLFLDEATSALDEKMEEEMYTLLLKKLPYTAIISVGHRKSLFKYHQKQLDLDGAGGWSLKNIEGYSH